MEFRCDFEVCDDAAAKEVQMPPSTNQRRVAGSRLNPTLHFLVSPFLSVIS